MQVERRLPERPLHQVQQHHFRGGHPAAEFQVATAIESRYSLRDVPDTSHGCEQFQSARIHVALRPQFQRCRAFCGEARHCLDHLQPPLREAVEARVQGTLGLHLRDFFVPGIDSIRTSWSDGLLRIAR